jgi:hypothetical protein
MRLLTSLTFSVISLVLLLPVSVPAIVEIGRIGQDPVIVEAFSESGLLMVGQLSLREASF